MVAITSLRDAGNTVIVIEHNIDVIACADWVIDLGPEGGERGGELVVEGTPETVAAEPASATGMFLAERLGVKPTKAPNKAPKKKASAKKAAGKT